MQYEDEKQLKWPARIFFTAVAIFVVAAVFYFFLGARDTVFYWNPGAGSEPTAYENLDIGDRIVLTRDRAAVLRRVRLVYRGLENGRIRIEATLLDLDSDYAYPHLFLPSEAATSVRLGGHTFRLVSWNRGRVSLELLQ